MRWNNLPLFFVRLTDQQAGHILAYWYRKKEPKVKSHLTQLWAADFDSTGKLRLSVGSEYGDNVEGSARLKEEDL